MKGPRGPVGAGRWQGRLPHAFLSAPEEPIKTFQDRRGSAAWKTTARRSGSSRRGRGPPEASGFTHSFMSLLCLRLQRGVAWVSRRPAGALR